MVQIYKEPSKKKQKTPIICIKMKILAHVYICIEYKLCNFATRKVNSFFNVILVCFSGLLVF